MLRSGDHYKLGGEGARKVARPIRLGDARSSARVCDAHRVACMRNVRAVRGTRDCVRGRSNYLRPFPT